MLVQKRDDGDAAARPMIKVKVSHGSYQREVSIPEQATLRDLKKLLSQVSPMVGYAGSAYAAVPLPNWLIDVSRRAEVMSLSEHAEVATRALQESLQRLTETQGRTQADSHRADENLSASLMNITALEKSLASAREKYVFMQKFCDFIVVICEFLKDKAPYIEELEEKMQRLHEERATTIVERRATDDADEMTEVQAAINAAKLVLSKGTGTTTAAAAARERCRYP